MRSLLILCSVISATYAGSLGYNYGSNAGQGLGAGLGSVGLSGLSVGGGLSGGLGVGGLSSGGLGVGGLSSGGLGVGGLSSGGLSSGSLGVGGLSSGGLGVGGLSSGGLSSGSLGVGGLSSGGLSSGGLSSVGAPAAVAETNKEFFTYSAPEYEFNDIGDSSQVASSLKKNLRVIFIKGPENTGLENAALGLAKSAVNERTAIYVLNKQADIGELANRLQSFDNRNSYRPEVHFVKYRTSADADNAQRTIQAQYDSLEGPTSNINGGTAPVLNFASQPAQPEAQQSYEGDSAGNVESAYLPPGKRA